MNSDALRLSCVCAVPVRCRAQGAQKNTPSQMHAGQKRQQRAALAPAAKKARTWELCKESKIHLQLSSSRRAVRAREELCGVCVVCVAPAAAVAATAAAATASGTRSAFPLSP